jgi:putative glutathione S-transferase
MASSAVICMIKGIVRSSNSAFDDVGAAAGDFYPIDLRDMIDSLNVCIYDTVNNGVYKAGFATTQQAYTEPRVDQSDTHCSGRT